MKKVLRFIFITIPNFPIYLVISIWIVHNIFKNTNETDIELQQGHDMFNKELKEVLAKCLPDVLFNSIALIFWLCLIVEFIN